MIRRARACMLLRRLCCADVRRIVGSQTIAVIVEVVQGEGGVVPAEACALGRRRRATVAVRCIQG
jgi:acetylornithine/succinyldiaminopimelate/putrescine aminotransferase